jgi:hypothetical protein
LALSSQYSAQSGTPDCPVVHRTMFGDAPDNVRCDRLASGELATLRNVWRLTAIIHRTVRWCTGLSGEPMAASATVGRAIRGRRVARANGRLGAPDCPVCTGQCPVRHPTEGKNCLPCWPPMAPSCLGAIKGPLGAWRKYPSIH